MKQEYIIVNKTKLLEEYTKQKEILEKRLSPLSNATVEEISSVNSVVATLAYCMNNSTPLEPIVSDALTNGINIASLSSTVLEGNEEYSAEVKYDEKDIVFYKQEYINNLKLDI